MARVKIGNVRTPIEYLKQFFAPAGYGWGEGSPAAQFNENNVNRTSVFVAASEDMPTSDSIWLCEFYATSSDGSGDYGHMVATSQGSVAKGCCCLRLKENGVYSEWEWVNPPMDIGVEYRTTERYMGLPVYTMLYDMGQLSNNGEDMPYYHVSAISGAKHLVESHVILSNAYGNEEEAFDFKVLVLPASTVQYGYKGDKSQYTGKLLIKYTY